MKLYIIHDSGMLYFEALREMEKNNALETRVFYVHFVQRLIKGCLTLDAGMVIKSLQSAALFLGSFFMSGRVFILGIAPYDPALLGWKHLANKNRVIYHTSWPYWKNNDQPFKPGFFAGAVYAAWAEFIKSNNLYAACVLERTRSELSAKFGKDKSGIFVIPHAVNTGIFRPRRKNNKSVSVFFAGRLVREKGLEDLVKVIRAADPEKYSFGIAGKGRDEALLKPVKGRTNVKFYGRINDRQELAGITAGYDVMLLPSYKTGTWEELFGIAVLEAWASGLAVIATDCIGPKHLIRHMKNGMIVKQRDTGAMIKSLEFLRKNRQAMKRISRAAVKSAGAYRLEKIMMLWDRLLKKACAAVEG